MESIKHVLFTNWHFMRWFRLAIGAIILVQAIQTQNILSGIVALFFLFQAASDTGCCGSNGCSIPNRK